MSPSLPPTREKTSRALPRKKFAGARAFYLVVLVLSIFTAFSLITGRSSPQSTAGQLLRRAEVSLGDDAAQANSGGLVRRDEACRLVHNAKDQCAFVRANCEDEEAGLFSYLQLYYCKLHKAQPVAFIILVLWLGLLFSTIGIAASDFFCINLSTIASILGMSESMAGVTFLAFGNGSPDVFSTFAAMKTHSGSLAVGELIGAAGFITAVVAGSMALARPFKVARKSFIRDVSFFIVAAAFSMVFLADGHLHLWECATMVAFYVFYVIFVVLWHWYLRRRSRRLALEDAARSHFHIPSTDEAEHEPYRDEEEEEGVASARRGPSRTVSQNDFNSLERGGSLVKPLPEEEDVDDETRDRYLAEISSNMRVSRPKRGERRNTINPIRPSLVGALEFRAVLSSLQKSRNIQAVPINLRRYSDDPTFTTAQQQDNLSTSSNPEISFDDVDAHDVASNASLRPGSDTERTGPNRIRAVSANDAVGLRLDPHALQRPQIDLLGPTPPGSAGLQPVDGTPDGKARTRSPSPPGSNMTLSPAGDEFGYLSTSPGPMSPVQHERSGDLLAPPDLSLAGSRTHLQPQADFQNYGTAYTPKDSPSMKGRSSVPRIKIPRAPGSKSSQASSPLSPFPEYFDDPNFVPTARAPSIRLPPSSIDSESTFHRNLYQTCEKKPLRWWPYKLLPCPEVLFATLFPTLYSWKDKNIWEKLLGIVAAPSVFVLATTLPIVEVGKEEDDAADTLDPDPGLLSPQHTQARRGSTLATLVPDSPTIKASNGGDLPQAPNLGQREINSPAINISGPEDGDVISVPSQPPNLLPQNRHTSSHMPEHTTPPEPPSSPKDWNRWLVATQIFTAPFFIVLLYWANTDPTLSIRNLLLPCLYSLIASLISFAILVLTTSPSRPPRYRYLLCFFGFIVSIAWISTIANEVVGVLKAFGVILGISDAILGLTIFAVGNSLGDLVADITVAKLGYPVMALSACFGGPMLNILLGIGISGLYMTIQSGEKRHEKHPGKPMKYKPYEIEVGGTLLISGITLMVALVGLLIVVPLRGWWMDRKVGVALVILWVVSTIGNVIVEVVGWGTES